MSKLAVMTLRVDQAFVKQEVQGLQGQSRLRSLRVALGRVRHRRPRMKQAGQVDREGLQRTTATRHASTGLLTELVIRDMFVASLSLSVMHANYGFV